MLGSNSTFIPSNRVLTAVKPLDVVDGVANREEAVVIWFINLERQLQEQHT